MRIKLEADGGTNGQDQKSTHLTTDSLSTVSSSITSISNNTNEENSSQTSIKTEDVKDAQQQQQPFLSSTAEDINKYYRPELVARFNGTISVNGVRNIF